MSSVSNDVYEAMKENKITLPPPPPKGGIYIPAMEFGEKFIYCSGCGPDNGNNTNIIGRLGENLTLEEGQKAAKQCVLNLLANLEQKLGDLNRIKKFVKVLAFVNSADDFYQQPQVVNGGSQLLIDLFGEEKGCAARTAIGTNTLPGNIACEIEALIEIA